MQCNKKVEVKYIFLLHSLIMLTSVKKLGKTFDFSLFNVKLNIWHRSFVSMALKKLISSLRLETIGEDK